MKSSPGKRLKDSLAKNHHCYVLITCDAPEADGRMDVQMTYEGDASLAAYLIQGAQDFIEEQTEDQTEIVADKIHYIH